MKRVILLTMILSLMLCKPAKAEELQIYKGIATAYNITGTTATGTYTTEGRTVASKREWFGYTLIMWADDGDGVIKPQNFIGMYQVEDTGGETVKSGKVIDVYIADYEKAVRWGSKKIIYQLVKTED